MSSNLRGREPRKRRVEFLLNASEMEELERVANAQDLPVGQVVRAALHAYLDERTPRGKDRKARRA